MPSIPFPNVPDTIGVPLIPRSPEFPPLEGAALGTIQGLLWRSFQIDERWGIFNSDGERLGSSSNFILESIGFGHSLSEFGMDYTKEMRISDFPIEKGGFANYNKVELPATPVVILVISGDEESRKTFLDAVDAACKSLDLYSVAMPELTYVDYSIEKYSYSRRAENGVSSIKVEITLKEIRQVSAQYTMKEPKDPAASPQVDSGKVQTSTPEKSTLKSIADKFLQGIQ